MNQPTDAKAQRQSTKSGGPLRGVVATVLNDRELVITVGRNQGVEVGMYFAVLSEDGLEIRHPETDELLDTYEREKVRVRAVEVKGRSTVCRTYKSYTTGIDLSGLGFDAASAFRPLQTHYETLDSRSKDRPKPLDPEDSYVRVGDPVKQVEEVDQ